MKKCTVRFPVLIHSFMSLQDGLGKHAFYTWSKSRNICKYTCVHSYEMWPHQSTCYLSGKMLMMPLHNEAFFSERDIITHNVLISLTSVLRVNTECKEEHSL